MHLSVARRAYATFFGSFLLLFSVTPALVTSVHAANLTWNNGAATGNWNTTDANWNGSTWNNSAPDHAIFNTTTGTITLTEAISAGSFTFGLTNANTTGAFTGSALAISGNLVAQADGSNYVAINPTLTFSNNVTVTGDVQLGRRNLEISGGAFTANRLVSNGSWGRLRVSGGSVTINNGIDDSILPAGNTMSVVLQSGSLHTPYIKTTNNWGIPDGDGVHLNGGTLFATANSSDFIQTYTFTGNKNEVAVGTGGAKINTNGFNITITKSMKNSDGAGALTKSGAGTLKLTAYNEYTGGTTIHAGTLELAGATGGWGILRGAVTVNAGATLAITGGDGTGFGWNNSATSLTINGGTLDASGGAHVGFGNFMAVALNDGGTISGAGQWNGDGLLGFSTSGNSTATISGSWVLRSDAGASHTFNVADGAAATDLLVSANLSDQYPEVSWVPASSLIKTGGGSMALTGSSTCDGATSVNGGILQLGDGTSGHDGTLANTSGISIASGASLVFNRFGNLTLGVAISGAGSVIKTGPGTQILTGQNHYGGGTTVSGGTLVAESSANLGSGDVTINAGGICEIRNPSGAIADVASVHLNGTGKLSIAAGVTEVVSAFHVDGVLQGVGSYDSSSLASHIVGGGSLQVVSGTVSVTTPRARQIFQRNGSNTGTIVISGTYTGTPERIEARMLVMPGSGNTGTPTAWTTIVAAPAGGTFVGTLAGVAAGGWYQMEVRSVSGGTPLSNTAIVQRVGVGELYVTAGQSNSANWGELGVNTDDRVSAMDFSTGAWSMAADPMPGCDGPRGSVWTRLGPLLTSATNVPVGFICVGVGGTPVGYWEAPSTEGYLRLKAAAQAFPTKGFRAVLWHQGESDSYDSTTTADYQARLSSAITQLRTDAGWAVPWYVAEASDLSNTTLTQEEPVMAGQRRVIHVDPLVLAGPATDDFHLEGKLYDGVHFNNAGMADHAQQWAEVLAGSPPIAPKNGNIESNPALADGGIAVVNMADTASLSVIGWHILNASGEAVADGGNGYFNPDSVFYGAVATDSGGSGGVLPNMGGRHVAFLYAGSDGNHFLQTRRATLQASTTYALSAALGVRGNGGTYGDARIELLANGTAIASREITLAELNGLNGGNAANTFTDVQLVFATGPTVAAGQALAIRISKIKGGGTSYLDFDNVRLTSLPNNDFGAWIGNPAFGLDAGDQDFDADPDGDHLTNGIEAWFGTHPGEPGVGITNIARDGATTTFTHPRSANPPDDISGFYRWSPDLVTWYAPDGLDGPPAGATVTVSPVTVGTTTTISASASEPLPRLFLRTEVVRLP